jgi:hypothetical protein
LITAVLLHLLLLHLHLLLLLLLLLRLPSGKVCCCKREEDMPQP